MNTGTLKRLGAALAALLVVWAVSILLRRAGRDEAGRLALAAVDARSVDQVTVARGADTLAFARQRAAWTVNGVRADGNLVDEMLAALGDTAARSELVAENAASHARLGLDSAAARRVTARQGGNVVADLLLGSRGSTYGTVHVRRPGEAAAYAVTGGLADVTDRQLDDWRDKLIAKVEPESVATVELTSGRKSWRLTRDATGWTVGTGPADSAAVSGLLDRFRNLTAAGFATAAQADSANFATPDKVVRLLAKGDRPLLVLSADSSASGFWVRREGDAATFRLDTWVMGGLVPDEGSLRKK
jgi:hypothetical protein